MDAEIAFGKYKGKRMSELVADRRYYEWCLGQPGIRNRPEFKALAGEMPVVVDNAPTPEHNRMQNMFLEKKWQNWLKEGGGGGDVGKVVFEARHNWDVVLVCHGTEERSGKVVMCELKPSLGDEYPRVLGKMRQQIDNTYNSLSYIRDFYGIYCKGEWNCKADPVLVVDSFSTESTTWEQLCAIFAQHGIRCLRLP